MKFIQTVPLTWNSASFCIYSLKNWIKTKRKTEDESTLKMNQLPKDVGSEEHSSEVYAEGE